MKRCRPPAPRGPSWLWLLAVLTVGGLSAGSGKDAAATAAPPPGASNAAQGRERDLGQGLVYFRVHKLPADLPPSEAGRAPPCVVDLRYVRTDAAGAAAFGFWIRSRATLRTPVFVVANRQTDGALLASARAHASAGGVLLVGIAGNDFQPDIVVTAEEETEKRAYDAFEEGATIASLLTDHPGKIRYDESSLGKEPRPVPPDAAAGSPAAPPTIVDPALQRAVHLHRTLVALKKL